MPAPAPSTRVLVVAAHRGTTDVLAEFLRAEGLEVWTAGDGPQALRLASEWAPDVVMADVDLPRRGVVPLLAGLRAHEPKPRIVVMTHHTAVDAAREATALAVDGFVNAPLDLDEILSSLSDRRGA